METKMKTITIGLFMMLLMTIGAYAQTLCNPYEGDGSQCLPQTPPPTAGPICFDPYGR